MSSVLECLFSCWDIMEWESESQFSDGHSTCSDNTNNGKGVNKESAYNVNKAELNITNKYSFIEASYSNNNNSNNNTLIPHINNSIHSNNSSLKSYSFFTKTFLSSQTNPYEENYHSPHLKLTGKYNITDIFYGKEFIITPSGIEHGTPLHKHITIFGTYYKHTSSYKENKYIDIVINIDHLRNNKQYQRVFAIEYSYKESSYYIYNIFKHNTQDIFMYIKINHEYHLTSQSLSSTYNSTANYLMIGSLLTVVTVMESNEINVKVFNQKGKNVIIERTFSQSNVITIGRGGCVLNVEHESISKMHCRIMFDKYCNNWLIEDGNGKGKHSKKGTWLILGYKGKFQLSTVEDKYQVKIDNKKFNIEVII